MSAPVTAAAATSGRYGSSPVHSARASGDPLLPAGTPTRPRTRADAPISPKLTHQPQPSRLPLAATPPASRYAKAWSVKASITTPPPSRAQRSRFRRCWATASTTTVTSTTSASR